jgi:hypothetical protein
MSDSRSPSPPFFLSFLLGHLKLLFCCWESQVQESGGLKEIVWQFILRVISSKSPNSFASYLWRLKSQGTFGCEIVRWDLGSLQSPLDWTRPWSSGVFFKPRQMMFFFFFFNFQIVESKMDEGSMLVVQLTSLQKESCQWSCRIFVAVNY